MKYEHLETILYPCPLCCAFLHEECLLRIVYEVVKKMARCQQVVRERRAFIYMGEHARRSAIDNDFIFAEQRFVYVCVCDDTVLG